MIAVAALACPAGAQDPLPAPADSAPTATAPTTAPPTAPTTAPPTAPTTAPPTAPTTAPTTTRGPASGAARRNAAGQYLPNGRPPGSATAFDWTASPVTGQAAAFAGLKPRGGFVTALVIGSDARPGEKVERSRGDSIHLVTWNQSLGRGAVLGIPRDTWVPIAGRGQSKINASLSWGGPELMRSTVVALTGIEVDRWMATGFDGFTRLVNELGGVSVEVTTSMNDPYSGAQFAPGWFSMNGDAALALVRNRKNGVPGGDVGRSRNQGLFLLALLTKAREQTRSAPDLLRWVAAMERYGVANTPPADLLLAAHLVRSVDPSQMAVAVLPVQNAVIGATAAQTVTPAGQAMLADLRTDGVLNGR